MKIIVAPRRAGKTTQLIKQCAQYKYALIVCNNRRMCEWTFTHAKEIGVDIPMPITYDELMRGVYRGKNIDAFLLDNAEIFLRSLTSSVPIVAIAMSEA
jgi:hypothetical protein